MKDSVSLSTNTLKMNYDQRIKFFRQLLWDYNFDVKDIEVFLAGKTNHLGHYSKEKLFKKMLETYSWFTILQIYSPVEIKELLTDKVINDLRMPSLRKQYMHVKKRLQQIIPVTG
jgi:hypothetical protein